MSTERLVKWSKEAQEFFEKANITDQEKSNDCKTNLQTKLYVNKILQYIPGCIYWKDVNGTYLGCNQMEAEILGLKSSDEIVGKTVYDLANQQTAKSPLYDANDASYSYRFVRKLTLNTLKPTPNFFIFSKPYR